MENKTTILFGGETIPITLADKSASEVIIRILPVKDFPKLLLSIDDEQRVAEIFCDKPQGWAETLSRESHEEVVLKGNELNQDFFSRWAQRRIAQQEKLVPGITERLASTSRNGAAK